MEGMISTPVAPPCIILAPVGEQIPLRTNPLRILQDVHGAGFINSAEFSFLSSWTLPVMMLLHGIIISAAYVGCSLTLSYILPPPPGETPFTRDNKSAIAFAVGATVYVVLFVIFTSYILWMHKTYPLVKAKGADFICGMTMSTILSTLFMLMAWMTAYIPQLANLPHCWAGNLFYSLSALFYTAIIALMVAKQRTLYKIFKCMKQRRPRELKRTYSRGLFADRVYRFLILVAILMVIADMTLCHLELKGIRFEVLLPMFPVLLALVFLFVYSIRTRVVHAAFNDGSRNITVCAVLSILIVILTGGLLFDYLNLANGLNAWQISFSMFLTIYMHLVAYSEPFVLIAYLAVKKIQLRTELSPTNTASFCSSLPATYISRGGSLIESQNILRNTCIYATDPNKVIGIKLPTASESIKNTSDDSETTSSDKSTKSSCN